MLPLSRLIDAESPPSGGVGLVRPRLCFRVGVIALVACVFSLAFGAPTLSGQSYRDQSEEELIKELQEQLAGDLGDAGPLLEELIRRSKSDEAKEPFVFLLGMAYQDAGENTKAVEAYRNYLRSYPDGSKRDFVELNLAGVYEAQEKFDEAMATYESIYRGRGTAVFRKEALNKLCGLYIRTGQAAAGIALFKEVFDTAYYDPEAKAQAASWLLQGYLAEGDVESMRPYLQYLKGPYEAMFDPAFNISLLKYGDSLFDQGDFEESILLYYFVKTRSQIIDFYENLVEELQQELSRFPSESERYTILEGQLATAKANLEAVEAIRSYDVDMQWRVARVYDETGRNWEALWAFYHLYLSHPDHEQAEDFLYTALRTAIRIDEGSMIEVLAQTYLNHEDWLKFRDPTTVALAEYYRSEGRFDEMMALIEEYLKNPADSATTAQLLSFAGMYFLSQGEYQALFQFMEPKISGFRGREPALETVRYWTALASLLMGDYASAADRLEQYVSSYAPGNVYYEDGFYRYAISLYGVQRFADSEKRFVEFVETFPESSLRGEAELYLGDLKRDRGDLDGAVGHYGSVAQHTRNDAFIGRAAFSLSEVREAQGQIDEAMVVLENYIDTYGQQGQLAEAQQRIGEILLRQERLPEFFDRSLIVIESLGDDANRYAVDELVQGYVDNFQRYDRAYRDAEALLRKLIEEVAFRSEFLKNRVFQYQYLQSVDGAGVDPALQELLVRDRGFRARVIETEIPIDPQTGLPVQPEGDVVTAEDAVEILEEQRVQYLQKAAGISPYSPDILFPAIRDEAAQQGQRVLALRMEYALWKLARDQGRRAFAPLYSIDELDGVPPRILIWQASLREEEGETETAEELYRLVLERHPYSKTVYETLVALGELALARAEASGDQADWEAALGYYQLINERYALRAKDATPYLRTGRILAGLGRPEEAIQTLSNILRNPQWRGLDHARAHLELGRVYRSLGNLPEAHGWFERLIVAYGGFSEIVAQAYYYDLLTLQEMGETESVNQLLEEYRTRVDVLQSTEAHALIKEKFDV